MSSDRRRLPLVALLLASLAFAACGKKGPPQPRPRAIPRPANDLVLRLRGAELTLTFSYPTTTLAGLPIPGLEEVTAFEARRPMATDLAPADAREIEQLGQPVLTLAGDEIGAAVAGAKLRLRITLPDSAIGDGQRRAYAVRSKATGGEISPWSNVASLTPRPAPAPPTLLSAEDHEGGVDLAWTAIDGTGGYAVLRRESTDPRWGDALASVGPDATDYTDTSAVYGTRYVYAVTARSKDDPRIESAPRSEREVDYRDRFAPAAPTGVRAVGLAGGVRVVWEASPAADVAGYLVERSNEGLRFSAVNAEPVDALEITDPDAPRGRRLTYRVTAVDRAGNRSEPSAEVDTRRP